MTLPESLNTIQPYERSELEPPTAVNKVCNDEKVKTEPDEFEDEDKKPLEDKVEGGGFNACDIEKVKTQPEEFKLQIRF